MLDTKTCENGHVMTGIGFDNSCPECEAPWKGSTKEQCCTKCPCTHIPYGGVCVCKCNTNTNWEDLRKEWRAEIKKYPQMDALGSADWWLAKLTSLLVEERSKVVAEAEIWLLRLHKEPAQWTVKQALKALLNHKEP